MQLLIKCGTLLLASLTTLGSLLVIFFIATDPPDAAPGWIVVRLLAAAFVVAMGVFTAMHMHGGMERRSLALLLGAIGLLALGSSGAVFGYHSAVVTGDLEAWAIMINLLVAAQGAGAILYLWRVTAR